jgi:hypothetical protein
MGSLRRLLAVVVGLALLAAVAHVNVVGTTDGYGSPTSVVILTLAAGTGLGAAFVGRTWDDGRKPLAVLQAVCQLARECYSLLQTMTRIVAGSYVRFQAPAFAGT